MSESKPDRDETPDVLKEARELLAGITPGPWRHVTGEGHAVKLVSSESGPVAEIWPRFSGDVPAATDAEFIAAAPDLVARLADDLAEVQDSRDHWKTLWKDAVEDATAARTERDEALAEVDRLRRAGETLGKVIDVQCLSALRAIGQDLGGDLIDADGDGDWAVVWDLLAELLPDRDAALAKVERLRRESEERFLQCVTVTNSAMKALAERDEALAAIGRVRELADYPKPVKVATGGGNLVSQRWVIDPDDLRRALDGGEQ